MSTFRNGLLLATLFLSACSMPILQDVSSDDTEKPVIEHAIPAETTTILPSKIKDATAGDDKTSVADLAKIQTLLVQYNSKKYQASLAYNELKDRMGKAAELPSFPPPESLTASDLSSAIDQLTLYTHNINQALTLLNERTSDRHTSIARGDLIQILISKATVSDAATAFEAQPVVGQWLRGERRTIRLRDNILFEKPLSEELTVTFSERYQLVINGQIISTVNPNRDKNSVRFDVFTPNSQGRISGQLDYRIVAKP